MRLNKCFFDKTFANDCNMINSQVIRSKLHRIQKKSKKNLDRQINDPEHVIWDGMLFIHCI